MTHFQVIHLGLGFLLRLLDNTLQLLTRAFFFFLNLKDFWGIGPDFPEA